MAKPPPRTKSISFMIKDYLPLEDVRKTWIEKHKANISMAQIIKMAMAEYKDKNL